MNSSMRKLSAGLAVAMMVSTVAPYSAMTAQAAPVISLKNGSQASNVYVTKSYALKLANNVSARWTSSNKAVSTVGLTGGVLKPVAPGKVTITAKSNVTGKIYRKVYNVKLRASDLEVSEDVTMAVGEKKQLKAVKTPANSTDVIRYFSDNKEVATVGLTGGLLTANKNGTANITVYSKATTASSNSSKYNVVERFTVTVGTTITSATQATASKLDVNFNTDMKEAKASDFSIVKDDTKQVMGIKGISVDGKKVTVETFAGLNDGKSYTVTYGEATYQFVATDNKVVSLAISPATISYQTLTDIKVSTLDANGVILGQYPYGGVTDSKLVFDVKTSTGYTSGSQLLLFAKGDTAKATATYHSNQYDANGQEIGNISAELTITAVDKAPVTVKEMKYTVGSAAPSDWAKLEANTKLAVSDENQKVFFYLKNSKDQVFTSGYTLETSNKDILLVNDLGNLSADVVAVAQGNAYVLVKDANGNVVYSLPISIVAQKKAAALVLDKTLVELSNSVNIEDAKDVAVEVKDQYGNSFSKTSEASVQCLATTAKDASSNAIAPASVIGAKYFTVSAGKVTFNGNTVEAGTYTYKLTVGDFSRTVTVVVKAPIGTELHQLVISDTKVDAKFDGSVTENKELTMKVAVTKGGVVDSYVDLSTATVVLKKDGTAVASPSVGADSKSLVFSVFTIDASNNVVKAAAGSYSIAVTVDGKTFNGGFVVEDTQAGLSVAEVKANTSEATTPEGVVADVFAFSYLGTKLDAVEVTGVETIKVGTSLYIKNATINVDVNGYKVPMKVTINRTITAANLAE